MRREIAAEIEREASHWLMRIDREGRTPELTAELEEWLAGDRRRRGAFLQTEATWYLLDRLGQPDEAANDGENDNPAIRMTRRRLLMGGAAAIAASFAGGLFFLSQPERIGTAVGEIRRVPLADGSTAAINTASEIAVAMKEARRIVRLDKGEAYFQVAHDRARPFIVEAGRIRVLAVGTAFSVRRRENGADVLVTEGVVEAWADGAEGNKARIAAGQRAFIADNAAISEARTDSSEVDRALAWRSGRVDLAGESLQHAVDEFNRYNARKIVIADPRLAQERFYGVFRTDDPEGFATAVHTSLNVGVSSTSTGIRIGG
jgi:transmembrane sensor